jgi:hypothetical protein
VFVCLFLSAFEQINRVSLIVAQISFTDGPLHMYSFLFSHVSYINMMALQVSEGEVLSVCNVVPACQDVFYE